MNDSSIETSGKSNTSKDQAKHSKRGEMQQQGGTLKTNNVYFESQGMSLLCGMHAVNNFLGHNRYDKAKMDEICEFLSGGSSFCNPHRHWLFGGDFDVNVLMYSLDQNHFQIDWHDKRIPVAEQDLEPYEGFLINLRLPRRWYHKIFCTSGRHWLCAKRVGNSREGYALLDSSQEKSEAKTKGQLLVYLNRIRLDEAEILKIKRGRDPQH